MMKILITGSEGFTAKNLIPALQKKPDNELYCTDMVAPNVEPRYAFSPADLTDYDAVCDLLAHVKPARLYHLTGSFSNKYDTDYLANVVSTKNILDSILQLKLNCRVLLIGSAAEYGFVENDDNPVKETQSLNPVSIYGLTKVFQTQVMKYYCLVHSMDIVMGRTFNIVGPGMSERLFIGRLFKQIDDYKKGLIDAITLGNLENKRDYLPIDTVIEKYIQIMENGRSGEVYNVGSGISIKIGDLLLKILHENGLSMDVVSLKNFDSRFDVKDVYADIAKVNGLMS